MTLGEALAGGTRTLEQEGIASPRLTAEVLLAHALGADRTFLYSHRDDAFGEDTLHAYRTLIERRVSGEPLQYITGIQEFYGHRIQVNPSVLIPRPETEFLVDAIIEFNQWPRPRIVDIGTGSGCVAISAALAIPKASVVASDISLEAVRTARANAARLKARVVFACVDSITAWSGPFEIVASNPPYVAAEERTGLQREVRDFEPEVALFGTGDPIDFYRRLLDEAEEHLVPGGVFVVEIGYSMEDVILSLVGPSWEILPTRIDLQGIPRVVATRKR